MRTLTTASKYDSKMYSRMTLGNILVVSQWVGLHGAGEDEYFQYITGKYLRFKRNGIVLFFL